MTKTRQIIEFIAEFLATIFFMMIFAEKAN